MNDQVVDSEQLVVVLTDTFRIEGNLGIFSGVRLTDYMNESKSFIPITDATVKDLSGRQIMKTALINVKKESIQLVIPAESVTEG